MQGHPQRLFIRGKLPREKGRKFLCVIGSRRWTGYGRDAVNKIIAGLQGYPISIVSGLAIGIDSIAHLAALDTGLHCVVFPGSSLGWNKLYPQTHLNLAKRVVESGGALISRWANDYPTGKWAFPSRNVLMAGIADAVLVVEAGYRSGSLMTAKHAEEFDRDVLAIPGSINACQSYGTHMLIRSGAALITSAEDVIEALGFPRPKPGTIAKSRIAQLDMESKAIMKIISMEETSVDDLSDKLLLPITTVNQKITLLEMEGLIQREGGMIKQA